MSERSRKRKTERPSTSNKRPETPQFDLNGDDGFDNEYPDEEYALKRQRNNAAVTKTRQKVL